MAEPAEMVEVVIRLPKEIYERTLHMRAGKVFLLFLFFCLCGSMIIICHNVTKER